MMHAKFTQHLDERKKMTERHTFQIFARITGCIHFFFFFDITGQTDTWNVDIYTYRFVST